MKCKICESEVKFVKTLMVRKSCNAKCYLCSVCGFMFINNPTWLEEAYKEPIADTDTGYVLRNVYLSRKTLVLLRFLFGTQSSFLDYAGGYGMLARLMRDYGMDFFTDDLHTPNLFMKGFEYKNQTVEALTCFECFEHFVSPIEEIEKMLTISKNIFFSTLLLPKEIPEDDWEYYGLKHGQHISFYSLETLSYIANKYKLNFCTDGANLHLFTEKKIPNWLFRLLLSLTKLQFDLIIRKMLKSKTIEDAICLQKK